MSDSTTGSKEVEDEWTVVRGRKKRQHTKRSSSRNADDGHLSCCRGHGPDLDLSSGKAVAEQKLREKFASSRERVRSSAFFKNLVEQMERLQILETLLANGRRAGHKACESHLSDGRSTTESLEQKEIEIFTLEVTPATKSSSLVEVVVLGVGSLLDSEVSRCQMSLALLLKDRFSCIGNILAYDPVLSAMECAFLTNLGCTPIVQDDKGRRRADSPTLFYMPHCGASLYNSVLEANVEPWCVGWISILGNSFQKYQDSWSVFPKPKHARPDCLLGLQEHVTEHSVNAASFPCVSAFNDMSWHLFPVDKIDRKSVV